MREKRGMTGQMNVKKYLILTEKEELLAKGLLEGQGAEDTMRLKIIDGSSEVVAQQEIVYLIGDEYQEKPLQCRVLRGEGQRVLVKTLMAMDPELRRNLRIPVTFESFLYPISGSWKGRKPLRSIDLSCGGLAFYASDDLQLQEKVEVVIPKTTYPLILQMQIIRKEECSQNSAYYAAKFINLELQEEHMIREAVFSIQLQNRRKGVTKEGMEDCTS